MVRGPEKELFEDLQARLEAQTERLSAALEAPKAESSTPLERDASFGEHRVELVRLASDARLRLRHLREGIEDGLPHPPPAPHTRPHSPPRDRRTRRRTPPPPPARRTTRLSSEASTRTAAEGRAPGIAPLTRSARGRVATTVRRQTKHVYIGVCAPTYNSPPCGRLRDAVFSPVGVKL